MRRRPEFAQASRRIGTLALQGNLNDTLIIMEDSQAFSRQLEERLAGGAGWRGNDWDLVFTTTVGTPLDGIAVTRKFQALLEAAGLPRQRFHDLRHACASLLIAQGVSPRVVMETLGHSQISLTMNTYSHVTPALGRAAAERMNELLGAPSADAAVAAARAGGRATTAAREDREVAAAGVGR